MISSHITLQVPAIKILDVQQLNKELESLGNTKLSVVTLKFEGVFSGSAILMFFSDVAMHLVNTLVGENFPDMDVDSIRSGTLCEVGNVVLNGVMGSISNILSSQLKYFVPEFLEATPKTLFSENEIGTDVKILLAKTQFLIEEIDATGDIMMFFEVSAFDKLMKVIDEL